MAHVQRMVSLHVNLWSTQFSDAWNSLQLFEQLIYIWFGVQTIAILTLFELILLR